jgi:hypothetical protein
LQWWLSQAPTQAFREKGGFQTPFLMSKKVYLPPELYSSDCAKPNYFLKKKYPQLFNDSSQIAAAHLTRLLCS